MTLLRIFVWGEFQPVQAEVPIVTAEHMPRLDCQAVEPAFLITNNVRVRVELDGSDPDGSFGLSFILASPGVNSI